MINLSEYGTTGKTMPPVQFQPAAKYIPAMDCLVYLREDVSYRAVRLDQYRTVLLHPQEDRAVGVKIKGVRFVAEKARAVLRSIGADTRQLRLITLWEMTLTEDGDEATAEADSERKRQYASRAKQLMEDAGPIGLDELPLAA